MRDNFQNVIIPNLLAAHALSGCDTVGSYFGIGKKTVIKVLKKNNINLSLLGILQESFENYFQQDRKFLLHCYNQTKSQTLKITEKGMETSFIQGKISTSKSSKIGKYSTN